MPAPRIPIDDPDDPRLADFRHLKTHNLTRGGERFVVEGEKLFVRLLESRYPLVSVLASERAEARVGPMVPDGVPLYVMPHARLEALVGFNFHRGVLACGARVAPPGLDELTACAGPGPGATLVVCPRVDNPENLGSIVRVADVFGVLAVVTGTRCPDPLSRRVIRVSMGTALRVPVVMCHNLQASLDGLRRDRGYRLAATVLGPPCVELGRYAAPGRLAVLFGCEGDGLDPAWQAFCDDRVTIPMRPGAESLNLAVAVAVVVHHLAWRASEPAP